MTRNKQESFASFLQCASILEERTYMLYKKLAEPVEHPLIKSLLLHMAYDSQEHSALLKGISGTFSKESKPPKNCEKKLTGIFATIDQLLEEANNEDKASNGNVSTLIEKLTTLESTLGEEYYILVQVKTLQFMAKEIREIYNVDIEDLRDSIQTIMEDEEHHEDLLSKMRKILAGQTEEKEDNSPSFKYETPDAWTKHVPPGIT
jgi:rubrerythrin